MPAPGQPQWPGSAWRNAVYFENEDVETNWLVSSVALHSKKPQQRISVSWRNTENLE